MNTQGQDNFVTALDERIRRISRESWKRSRRRGADLQACPTMTPKVENYGTPYGRDDQSSS